MMPNRDEIALTIAKMDAGFDGDEYFEWRSLVPLWQENYLAMADAILDLFRAESTHEGGTDG